MALVRARRPQVTAEESRRQLIQELLELPELHTDAVGESPLVVAPPVEEPEAKEAEYDTVGLVFVHGVGSQRKGDTLREFATPLVDWVEEWHRSRGMVSKVTWAELSQPGEPASAAVVLPECPNSLPDKPAYRKQRWMLAEAWWAPRVAAPEYVTMLSWAWKRVPWLIDGLWDGAQQAWRQPVFFWDDPAKPVRRSRPRSAARATLAFFERLGQVLNTVAVSILYVLAQLVLMIVLLLLGVIARLPLLGLDQFVLVRVVRPLVVDNVGDFYVFVYDRIQAVHIRQSIYETVNWLVKTVGCSRVVIAAHSGGTVVAVDALGTPDLSEPGGRRLPEPMEKVDTLITFGAALNRAWAEGYEGDLSKPARIIPEYLHPPAKWLNFWTHFDWAHPGRSLDHGQASGKENENGESIPVINGLSPLSDHGGYLSNYEQFISRLAQEVEGPASTRFADDQDARDRSRRARVGILTAWRAFAVMSAIVVLGYRYLAVGRDAVADGEALWDVFGQIPVVGGVLGTAGSIGGLLSAIPSILPLGLVGVTALAVIIWASLAASRLTLIAVLLFWALVFLLVDPTLSSALRRGALAFSTILAVFLASGLAYWSYLALVFSAWDVKVSLLSARAAPDAARVAAIVPSPERTPNIAGDLAARTAIYAVIAVGLAFLLATAPAFADIPSAVLATLSR